MWAKINNGNFILKIQLKTKFRKKKENQNLVQKYKFYRKIKKFGQKLKCWRKK